MVAIMVIRVREYPLGAVESAMYLRSVYEYIVIIIKLMLLVVLGVKS